MPVTHRIGIEASTMRHPRGRATARMHMRVGPSPRSEVLSACEPATRTAAHSRGAPHVHTELYAFQKSTRKLRVSCSLCHFIRPRANVRTTRYPGNDALLPPGTELLPPQQVIAAADKAPPTVGALTVTHSH